MDMDDDGPFCVVACLKGVERYVVIYRDDLRTEALKAIGRFASNRELSFTWYDAAVCRQRIIRQTPHES